MMMIVFRSYSLALSLSRVFHVHLFLLLFRCHRFARARWAIPDFQTSELFFVPGKDAAKSVTSLVEALGWIEAARGAAPPLAMVRPTATRQDANMAVVNAFFGQSSLTKAGFSKGGVVPFWESPLISMQSLLRFGPDEMRDVLDRDPRALLIKSDLGSCSFSCTVSRSISLGWWTPGHPRSHRRDNHSNQLCLGQVFRQSWSSLPSKFWLPGIVC